LQDDLARTGAAEVICLGDSFDDLDAARGLAEDDRLFLMRLMAGRRWIWAEGNHDPGPVALAGTHLAEVARPPLVFRHVATPAVAEVSGHYHPKARLGPGPAQPCFLIDAARVILPAYGTYTGGLPADAAVLAGLMGRGALAVLTGQRARAMPMPR
jgi:metallophosphoesterase superfamily enzyme